FDFRIVRSYIVMLSHCSLLSRLLWLGRAPRSNLGVLPPLWWFTRGPFVSLPPCFLSFPPNRRCARSSRPEPRILLAFLLFTDVDRKRRGCSGSCVPGTARRRQGQPPRAT